MKQAAITAFFGAPTNGAQAKGASRPSSQTDHMSKVVPRAESALQRAPLPGLPESRGADENSAAARGAGQVAPGGIPPRCSTARPEPLTEQHICPAQPVQCCVDSACAAPHHSPQTLVTKSQGSQGAPPAAQPLPAASPPPAPAVACGELSEYERQRLLNIAQNNRLLMSLGLLQPREPKAAERARRPIQPKPLKRVREVGEAAPAPPRRSTRANKGAQGDADVPAAPAAQADGAAAAAAAEEDATFEDSAVLRYVLAGRSHLKRPPPAIGAASSEARDAREHGREAARGFRRCAHVAECVSSLCARIYSIDLAPVSEHDGGDTQRRFGSESWLVATAGEKGLVEVYGLAGGDGGGEKLATEEQAEDEGEEGGAPSEQEVGALLSFEAHRGWVGGVQLLPALSAPTPGTADADAAAAGAAAGGAPAAAAGSWLLSSANDGALRLWDLSLAAARPYPLAGTPRLVAAQTTLHAGKVRAAESRLRPAPSALSAHAGLPVQVQRSALLAPGGWLIPGGSITVRALVCSRRPASPQPFAIPLRFPCSLACRAHATSAQCP